MTKPSPGESRYLATLGAAMEEGNLTSIVSGEHAQAQQAMMWILVATACQAATCHMGITGAYQDFENCRISQEQIGSLMLGYKLGCYTISNWWE